MSDNPDEVVLRERRDRTLIITINRPEARNAFNTAVAQGLADAMDELDDTPELSVGIVTGAGGNFCAGMDLKAFMAGEVPTIPGRGIGFTERPPRKPLIAAVEGYALAGGTEIVLATDLVVAARNAKFGIPEVKRGLVAAGGGLLRLQHRIPYQKALELALTGDSFTAEEASQWGFVNVLTDAVEGGRALARRAAWYLDHEPAARPELAPAAFLFLADVAPRAATTAVQVQGGLGVSAEAAATAYLVRARGWSLAGGDPAATAVRIGRLVAERESA